MRLAVVGKGGSGKSFISGTLARILARAGHQILALDVDTVPGLAVSLGLSTREIGDAGLPENLTEKIPKKGWQLKTGVNINAVVQKHAIPAADNIRFLQLGKLPDRVKPASTVAFRYVMEKFDEDGWHIIADLAAGTRQPFFGWSNFADVILIVVNPTVKSILTARRLARLAEKKKPKEKSEKHRKNRKPPVIGLIANKLRDADDSKRIVGDLRQYNFPLFGEIPDDRDCWNAESAGNAIIENTPDSPAVKAIETFARRLTERFIQ